VTVKSTPDVPKHQISELAEVTNIPSNFKAGKIKTAIAHWFNLTSDKELLSWVHGVHIDFERGVTQLSFPAPIKFSDLEREKMNLQLHSMLLKGVTETARPSQGQFISNVFCRPRKDGSVRIILNLRQLNEQVEYHHFKMETLSKPRTFSKLLKVPFAYLRARGHENSAYIDDSCLLSLSFTECQRNVHDNVYSSHFKLQY